MNLLRVCAICAWCKERLSAELGIRAHLVKMGMRINRIGSGGRNRFVPTLRVLCFYSSGCVKV
jgi:hypothetical protein